jgi:hypothetical protein
VIVGFHIRPVAVRSHVESDSEIPLDVVEVSLTGGQPLFDGVELDPILFRLEQPEGDGTRVVGLEQFRTLLGKPLLLCR